MKTLGRILVAALVGAVALGGCLNAADQTIATRYVKKQAVTAATGGTVEVTAAESAELAGTRLEIPAGSLASDATITVALQREPLAAAPDRGVGPVAVFGPAGLEFKNGARLTLPFSASGIDPRDLYIQVLEETGEGRRIEHASVRIDGARASFTVSGFTRFQATVQGCNRDADCGQGLVCVAGECRSPCGGGMVCQAGSICCGSLCVDLLSDATNCGACNHSCASGEACANGICSCFAEPDAQFCARYGAQCGTIDATDNCGLERITDCGSCDPGIACVQNLCGDVPWTDEQFCKNYGAECGTVTGTDNFGNVRTAQCGPCAAGMVCDPATSRCVSNTTCETDAQICHQFQASCGIVQTVDSCGVARYVDCGVCPDGSVCDLQTKQCVLPESDIEFCARNAVDCDDYTAQDNTGATRTVNCGQCPPLVLCYLNVCMGEVPETDQTFCANQGAECGVVTGVDNTGASRAVDCGTCTAGVTCDPSTHQCQ